MSHRGRKVFLLFSMQFYKMSQGNSADFESVNSILPFEWCLDFELGIKLQFASLLPSKRYYAVLSHIKKHSRSISFTFSRSLVVISTSICKLQSISTVGIFESGIRKSVIKLKFRCVMQYEQYNKNLSLSIHIRVNTP